MTAGLSGGAGQADANGLAGVQARETALLERMAAARPLIEPAPAVEGRKPLVRRLAQWYNWNNWNNWPNWFNQWSNNWHNY